MEPVWVSLEEWPKKYKYWDATRGLYIPEGAGTVSSGGDGHIGDAGTVKAGGPETWTEVISVDPIRATVESAVI